MVNYKNGKIYKIVNTINDDIYIGSTCDKLCKRMVAHRAVAKSYEGNSNVHITMRELGVDNFKIILIESYPCESTEQLRSREDYWIKEMKAKLNIRRAFLTEEETRQQHVQSAKQYYHTNKQKVKDYHNEYNQTNKNIIKYKNTLYREKNKSIIRIKKKISREKNIDRYKSNERQKKFCYNCQYGIRKGDFLRHTRSIRHINNSKDGYNPELTEIIFEE